MTKKQNNVIQEMSDRELLYHLYFTQCIILLTAIIMGFFLFADFASFLSLWKFNLSQIFIFGVGSALAILLMEFILSFVVPASYFDDGGINEKVFKKRSIAHIALIAFVVAMTEEILFRGVIQTHFGLIIASVIFAVVHVRYITKILLFSLVVLVSFWLGALYELTENLAVTVVCHFLIDFILGVFIRTALYEKWKYRSVDIKE